MSTTDDQKDLHVRVVSNEELTMHFKSRNDLIAPVRAVLREFAGERGFDPDEIYDLQLAVNEAIANIIEHAYKGATTGEIVVGLEMKQEALEILIKDWGIKVPKEHIKSRELDDIADHGLGVFLMHQLMDDVVYDLEKPEGTELLLRKNRTES